MPRHDPRRQQHAGLGQSRALTAKGAASKPQSRLAATRLPGRPWREAGGLGQLCALGVGCGCPGAGREAPAERTEERTSL